ncbi:MAG: hypothetical protein ACXU88_02225 [Myxococcaceae bacterium]
MSQPRRTTPDRPLPPMPGLSLEEMQRAPIWGTLALYAVVLGSMLAFIVAVGIHERMELARQQATIEDQPHGVAHR